jgi:hypothetical protein
MSCGLFNLPIASDRLRAVFCLVGLFQHCRPSGHGAILQATLRIRGNVNVRSGRLGVCGPGRRQGADPRRGGVFAERGATGGARGDIVQEIIAIVRQVASGLPSEQPNPLDDGLPGG